MTDSKPMLNRLTQVLLAACLALVAGDWYLQPGKAETWLVVLLFLGIMAVALVGMSGRESEGTRSIRTGIVFAGLMLVLSLGATMATQLGAPSQKGLSERGVMVLIGAFFVVTGNAIPKTLRPLASVQCDPGRLQAFQRFAGWTWVLTGIGYASAWLMFPESIAQPLSLVLLLGGMAGIGLQLIRLRRPAPKEEGGSR